MSPSDQAAEERARENGRLLEAGLTTAVIGHPCLSFDSLGSTSDRAKELAERGAEEGLAVLAGTQTRGRGRRGRSWVSTPGAGVYLSIVLRPGIPASDAGWLSIFGGVAVAACLERCGLRDVRIKWPNDVLVKGRKIAGVLVEPRIGSSIIDFVVVGIGINVSQGDGEWSPALKGKAISCSMAGAVVSRERVAEELLTQLDRWYAALKRSEFDRLMQAWVTRGGTEKVPLLER